MKFRKVGVWALLLMVVATIVFPTSAFAEEVYIEAMDITVNKKEQPTRTVVVDDRGVLTAEEINAIEKAGEQLQIYNLGLYIEMTDKSICSQERANQLAEEKYSELLPLENSVLIVFSFYEDAYGYYSVHYVVQGDLSERKVSNIIDSTYHDFKTDGSWITGSTQQVVDYLVGIENDLLSTDARVAAEAEAKAIFLRNLRIALEVLGINAIVVLMIISKRKEKALTEIIEDDHKQIRKMYNSYDQLGVEKSGIERQYQILTEWKQTALAAEPQLEEKIETHLAKIRAKQFSKDFKSASTLEEYDSMFNEYDSMSEKERSFVELDMEKARAILDKLAKAKAEEATRIIEEGCRLKGTRKNYDSYSRTLRYYNGLPDSVRILLAVTLINSLRCNYSNAQADHARYQRHLQESSYSHHSSSNSSYSSFGGGFHSGTFGGGFGGGH